MGTMFGVKRNEMQSAGNEMRQICGSLRGNVTDINTVRNSLSFQAAARGRIERRLSNELTRMTNEIEKAAQMQKQLETILKLYVSTESRLAGGDGSGSGNAGRGKDGIPAAIEEFFEWFRDRDSGDFPAFVRRILEKMKELAELHPNKGVIELLLLMATGAVTFADPEAGGNNASASGEDGKDRDAWKKGPWSFTKNLIDLAGKYLKEKKDRKTAGSIFGFTADGLSYLENVYDFLTGDKKGMTGASDLCNLADSSCSVWNGFYKIIENKNKDLFEFADKAGKHKTPYGARWSRISDSVSIAGDLAGWGGDLIDIFDNEKNPTGVDKQASFFKSTSHGVDIATTIYDIKSKTDAAGIYTPAMLYGTLADTGIETVSVAYKDIRNLQADGWSVDDTAQTMLDSSTSGLYKMVEKLTLGLISEDTTGVSAQQISDTMRDGAKKWGEESGRRVVNNPWLRDTYNNGNGFTKACVLTYSIAETGFDYAKQGAKTVAEKTADAAGKAWDMAKKAGETVDSLMPWRW